MLKEKMEKTLCEQINAEIYSSYLYLSMSAYFQSLNLEGFASWMKVQALEEMYHAMKIFGYIEERGGRVTLETIEKPPPKWESPLKAFEAAYQHERKVSGMIDNLVNLAIEEHDHASNNFLQWFVSEQVEEEVTADGVVQKLKLAGDQGSGLFMLDREMALRVFNLPPDLKISVVTTQA
jgi:ferritin